MAKRTQSLSYPSDPLASLRELQDLDAPGAPSPFDRGPSVRPAVAAPPEADTTGSADGRAPGSAEASGPAAKRPRSGEPKRDKPASDPMGDAVRRLLAAPYGEAAGKGAVTVSTVKIPTEVWERLGWVAKLSGRTKQDLITDALKRYFETVLKG